MTCKDCIHYDMCYLIEHYGADEDKACVCKDFKNKSDYAEVKTVSEKIIRKQAEVSNYWQNDVKQYRAMKGYSDIEHDTDNFLRGYNEAVEDMLAILDGRRDA